MTERQVVRAVAALFIMGAAFLPVAPAFDSPAEENQGSKSGITEILGNPDHRRYLLWARMQRSETDPNGFIWGPSITPTCPPGTTTYAVESQHSSYGVFDKEGTIVSGTTTPFRTYLDSKLSNGAHSGTATLSCMNGETLVESSIWELWFNLKG